MASLTTVYIISIVLASLSGIGSAFVGHTFYKWGEPEAEPEAEPEVPEKQPEAIEDADLKTLLEKETGKEDVAKAMMDFIETPVMEWEKIASTLRELVKKYNISMSHPDKKACPPKLLKICNMVSVKFSRMRDFIQDGVADQLGNQTAEALAILRSTE